MISLLQVIDSRALGNPTITATEAREAEARPAEAGELTPGEPPPRPPPRPPPHMAGFRENQNNNNNKAGAPPLIYDGLMANRNNSSGC